MSNTPNESLSIHPQEGGILINYKIDGVSIIQMCDDTGASTHVWINAINRTYVGCLFAFNFSLARPRGGEL